MFYIVIFKVTVCLLIRIKFALLCCCRFVDFFLFFFLSFTDAALCGRESPENIGPRSAEIKKYCCTSQSVTAMNYEQTYILQPIAGGTL